MRIPWTLWRAVCTDLWRLLLLSTGVLVAVISFVAAVRFFADGRLGPIDTLRFMLLAIPPMMAYALPFAASFAATLAYHRMASDNELTAAYAGGVPHRAVLAPAFATGLLLAAGLLALNEQVIPRFLRSMEQMVTRDMTKLLVGSIDRGDSIQIDNLIVQADSVMPLDVGRNPRLAEAGVIEWLIFDRFVALEFGSDGQVVSEALARRAQLVLYPAPEDNPDVAARAWLVLEDGVRQSPDGDFFWRGAQTELGPFDVPDAFNDNPKFLTFGELAALRHHPDRMNFIDQRRRTLARHIAIQDMRTAIHQQLAAQGRTDFALPGDRTLTLFARALRDNGRGEWDALHEPDAEPGDAPIRIEIRERTPDGRERVERRSARGARLRPEAVAGLRQSAGPDRALTLRLELTEVSRSASDVPALGDRSELVYDALRAEADPLHALLEQTSPSLVALARERGGGEPHAYLAAYVHDLERALLRLDREITSKQHERWAMAASVLVMIACGSVVAMLFAQTLPLPVYLATFFPALAAYLTISTGQRMVHNAGPAWIALLWAGIVALGALAAIAFARLRRH